jgi:hypothetical protein
VLAVDAEIGRDMVRTLRADGENLIACVARCLTHSASSVAAMFFGLSLRSCPFVSGCGAMAIMSRCLCPHVP